MYALMLYKWNMYDIEDGATAGALTTPELHATARVQVLHLCYRGFGSPEVSHCVAGLMVTDVWNDRSAKTH